MASFRRTAVAISWSWRSTGSRGRSSIGTISTKQRYWVSDTAVPTASATSEAPATRLHPLVTSNVSTLRETCFLSLLSDQHYYARDHKVNGEMFFPGAGFLEIACVNGTIAGEGTVTSIRDIVWMEPLRFSGGTVSVKTFLKANGHGTEFVIVSFNEENERIVHSEGRLLQGPVKPAPRAVSIADLKQQCGRSLQGAMCYREFEKFGFRYGPAFRTLQELYVGSNFALSKLQLAAELSHDFDQYLLHPCLIDGAMQTVIGVAGEAESDTPYLPFALDEVEILRPVPRVCYAYAELAPSEHGRADIKRFNIQLLNESGEVLVRLNSFYVRALVSAEASRAGHSSGALVSE
jgi:polyketide synthase PksL